ncbi:MAG: AmmeMemoRadiSam system protein A [Christensenellales bacterium]
MTLLGAVVLPHPPLIVPAVGRGAERQVQETLDACREAARWIVSLKPETLVLLSPHAPMRGDCFHLSSGEGARGNLGAFRAPQVAFDIAYDKALREALLALCRAEDLAIDSRGEATGTLDHGAMVPLHFLKEAAGGSLPWRFLRLGLSGLPPQAHYRLGEMIDQAAGQLGRPYCVVASGDLSHYLKEDGPYGFRPEGPRYDRQVMDILSRGALRELLDMPEAFPDQAGSCGQRSFLIMAGCFGDRALRAQRLSYQGVTGVGYGVCRFEPEAAVPAPAPDPCVALARQSYEHYVLRGRAMSRPAGLPPELLSRRAGVFVSLHLGEDLRGCIGTLAPTTACLADEIIHNAISAATGDPRFPPVTAEELPRIHCSVDVLGEPEDIASPDALDVRQYGVIVSRGGRRGVLLPDLEGVDTVAQQVAIARRKAGIAPGEAVRLQRFQVVRHT